MLDCESGSVGAALGSVLRQSVTRPLLGVLGHIGITRIWPFAGCTVSKTAPIMRQSYEQKEEGPSSFCYVLVQTEANADSEVDGTVMAAEMLSGVPEFGLVQTEARHKPSCTNQLETHECNKQFSKENAINN